MKDYRKGYGDTGWFVKDRFGLFIHWGLYAMPARKNEWIMSVEEIPAETYESRYFKHFEPDLYDPVLWAKTAKQAGMKYFIITTKHHEGFCLWDSELTDYKAPNTPAGRDLLKPMVEAFRNEGIRIGFYHSLIDWHHPQFIIDPHIGPYRNSPRRHEMNQKRDGRKYAEYLHGQVREILTNYGKIDILWLDFSYKNRGPEGKGREDWQSEILYKLVRELQPHIIINDRLDLEDGWDVKTPEQFQPRSWLSIDGRPVVWEACQTIGSSWGYKREEASWRDTDEIIRTLIDCVSKGGNLLLNVGPDARGQFESGAVRKLEEIGEWMRVHGRSIYNCTMAPEEFPVPENCKLTYNPDKKRLYIHILAWPYRHLHLDGKAYKEKVDYIQLLNDASEIDMETNEWFKRQQAERGDTASEGLSLTLPLVKPDARVPVLELFLKD